MAHGMQLPMSWRGRCSSLNKRRSHTMEKATKFDRKGLRITTVLAFAMWLLALPAWAQSAVTLARAGALVSPPRTHIGHRADVSVTLVGSGAGPVLTFSPGIASTVAGTGVSGYSGDGGPGTSAQ